jgi:hypothetical protein
MRPQLMAVIATMVLAAFAPAPAVAQSSFSVTPTALDFGAVETGWGYMGYGSEPLELTVNLPANYFLAGVMFSGPDEWGVSSDLGDCGYASAETRSCTMTLAIWNDVAGPLDRVVSLDACSGPCMGDNELWAGVRVKARFVSSTKTTVGCSPAKVTAGSSATCTVTVNGADRPPTGDVTLSSTGEGTFTGGGSCTLVSTSDGSSCTLSYTPSGSSRTDTITASYPGDSGHKESSGTGTVDFVAPLTSLIGSIKGTVKIPSLRRGTGLATITFNIVRGLTGRYSGTITVNDPGFTTVIRSKVIDPFSVVRSGLDGAKGTARLSDNRTQFVWAVDDRSALGLGADLVGVYAPGYKNSGSAVGGDLAVAAAG